MIQLCIICDTVYVRVEEVVCDGEGRGRVEHGAELGSVSSASYYNHNRV